MRLNCNRASGTWSSQPGVDGSSGTFELGPLAMTRAFCPPPSLDTQIARQAEYLRDYLLRRGRLYLGLMADGGIDVWEPVAESVAFETTPDPEIESAILAASPSYTWEVVDLNDDGDDELFVYLLGWFFCGSGGCNLQLLTRGEVGYTLVSEFSTSRTPVVVTSETSKGWKDFWRSRSRGGAAANYIADRFDGERYVDAEEIPAAEPPAGMRVLSGEFSFTDGIPLRPRD